MNPGADSLLQLQELARQAVEFGRENYGREWKKGIHGKTGIPVKSLTSFIRRARLGTIKRPPSFETKLRVLIRSDAAPLAAEMQRQWTQPFQAVDEGDLKPKDRAIWRKLLMRLVTVAESDPAQAAYVKEMIAGMEAKLKGKARRKRRRR